MEDRRLLLAIALSLLVLTGYQLLFAPPPPKPPEATPAASASAAPPASVAPAPPTGAAAATPPPVARPVTLEADDRERRVEANGPHLMLAFSNRGARLITWTLPTFRNS